MSRGALDYKKEPPFTLTQPAHVEISILPPDDKTGFLNVFANKIRLKGHLHMFLLTTLKTEVTPPNLTFRVIVKTKIISNPIDFKMSN